LHRTQSAARELSAPDIVADQAKTCALFLDCDGTLLDIALTPDEVTVPPDLVELLVRVSRGLGGALAIVTGRQLFEIDELLAPAQFVGSGVHGSELRTMPGGPITRVATSLAPDLVAQVIALATRLPGIIAEPKGPGIAVHYRLAPDLKETVEAEIRALIAKHPDDLVLCPGRKLFEIIPAGHSKGSALTTLSSLPSFAARRPVMVGDDVGDLPAFAAAESLGGFGLRVGGGHFERGNADFDDPGAVKAWLAKLARRLGT